MSRIKSLKKLSIMTGLCVFALASCVEVASYPTTPAPDASPQSPTPQSPAAQAPVGRSQTLGVSDFTRIVALVEPVAERECRNRIPGRNCDFQIIVETNPKAPANAWQSEDAQGRPTLTFTVALIADVQNTDELAFIMGHEAAHHISGHLTRTNDNAMAGALLGSVLAATLGADTQSTQVLQDVGATFGARSFSKDFELEADQLGTIIAYRSGFNPVRGAAYFTRIPDPGDRFLGTHPPNAQRIETVRRTMATL